MISTISSLLTKIDINGFYAINKRMHSRRLSIFMKGITQLGSLPFSIAASLFFLIYDSKPGVLLIFNLLAGQAVIQLLKRIVNRPRPYRTFEWVISLKPPRCKYSLPSGHSSSALTIALVVSHYYPPLKLLLLAAAAAVGISRIYLGCHYPSDVSIGFFISYIVYIVIRWMSG